jgi:c-di-GMP-binding flagellar brake protein YcgR
MQEKAPHKDSEIDCLEMNNKRERPKDMKIHDISIGGISLKAQRKFNVGSEYTLRIKWDSKELTVKGIVIWSSLIEKIKDAIGNTISIYRAGLKFTDIANGKLREIVNFIESNKRIFDQNIDVYSLSGERLYMRFQIENPDKALVVI